MTFADKCPRGSNRRDFPNHCIDGAGAALGKCFAQVGIAYCAGIWQGMESRRDVAENLVRSLLGIFVFFCRAAARLKERRRILEKEVDFLTACRNAFRSWGSYVLWISVALVCQGLQQCN